MMTWCARVLAALLAPLLGACAGAPAAAPVGAGAAATAGAGAGREIVVTTTILADVVGELAGAAATVTTLFPAGADPHDVSPSARDAERLRSAAVVVVNGLGLEAGIAEVLDAAAADGARVVAAGDAITALPFAGHAEDAAHAEDDREDEDPALDAAHAGEEGGLDPHFWQDPQRMMEVVRALAEELDAVLPDPGWAARADTLIAELEAVDAESAELLEPIPDDRRVLVTNHEAFGYFADRYGFEVVGTVIPGGGTLAEPSAEDLEELVATIREHDVPAIFAETVSPTRLAEVVGAEVGAGVEVVELYSDALGEPGSGADSYAGMLLTNAERVAAALS